MRLFGPPDSDKFAFHKLSDSDMEWIGGIEYTNYPGGVMHFHNAFQIDQDLILPYIDSMAYVPPCGLNIVKDADGNVSHGTMHDGTVVDISDLLRLPMRVGGGGEPDPVGPYTPEDVREFFEMIEETLYMCLVRYVDLYPLIINTVQWRMRGHCLRYSKEASLGLHNDNDTNTLVIDGERYVTGRDIAMYQVVNCLAYFNDDYEGGEFRFPYSDVTLKPETGDVVFFPANYIGSHGVAEITGDRYRYTYLSQFGHGGEHKYEVAEAEDSNQWLPPVYVPFLNQDMKRFQESPFSHFNNDGDRQVGLDRSTIHTQERKTEGPPKGKKILYSEAGLVKS